MNCAACLKAYFGQLEKDFHFYYMEVLRALGEETIHDLRVNMKKQRAFFRLLEVLDPAFSAPKARDAFREFYQVAGQARDYEVEQGIIRKDEELLQLDHQFSSWLAAREKESKEELQRYEQEHSLAPVRDLFRVVYNSIDFLPAEDLRDDFRRYFSGRIAAVREQATEVKAGSVELHRFRKSIKELFYNLKMLIDFFPEQPPLPAYETLNTLQKLLGGWHDNHFTLQRIEAGHQQCPEEVKRQLISDRSTYEEEVRESLDELDGALAEVGARIDHMLAEEPMLAQPRQLRSASSSRTRESFHQENMGEGLL